MKTKFIALAAAFFSAATSAQTIDIYCSMVGTASNDPTTYYVRIVVDVKNSTITSRNARMASEKSVPTPAKITESTIEWESDSSFDSIDRINGGYVVRQSRKGAGGAGSVYARGQCKKVSEKLF